MAKANLSADRLRELLDYNPETGVFTWRLTIGKAKSGGEAGWIEKAWGYGKPRRSIEVDQHNYRAHRLAWLYVHGAWPTGVIDHINGDSLDNRIANLRDVSQKTNVQNERKGRRHSKSGLLGAHWNERDGCWLSHIKVGDKLLRIGSFPTAEAAHTAYIEAKRRLHEGCTI